VIDTSRPTLASVFQEAGYATGVVGKWHLGLGTGAVNWNERTAPGPLELGFDSSFLMPSTNDRVPTVYVEGHHVQNLSEEDPDESDNVIEEHPEIAQELAAQLDSLRSRSVGP
jgi:arylsulfatase A-like enzyme